MTYKPNNWLGRVNTTDRQTKVDLSDIYMIYQARRIRVDDRSSVNTCVN
jgi:hypothetical protein